LKWKLKYKESINNHVMENLGDLHILLPDFWPSISMCREYAAT
jgi:hypothetical protein